LFFFLVISIKEITSKKLGESTFSVRIAKDISRLMGLRIKPIFAIELHIRDLEVLKKIKEFFNVGSITVSTRDGKPTGTYSVQSLKDLTEVIIPHFKEYPLLTHKKADFIFVISYFNE
jgi:hypothetical protein